MRVYLSTFDAQDRPLCGTDFCTVLPERLRTDRGRVRWAQRLLAQGNGWRLARVARAVLVYTPPGRPYAPAVRMVPVPLPEGGAS